MTAGFAGGPLVAGACAQWLPSPEVTAYLPHLAVLVAAAGPAWRTPDPGRVDARNGADATTRVAEMAVLKPGWHGTSCWSCCRSRRGCSAPRQSRWPTCPCSPPPAPGTASCCSAPLATGLAALAGIAAQPLARTARRSPPGRLLPASMALVLAGMGCAAWAAQTLSLPLVLLASAVLGVAYGITQFAGLAEVQRIADPRSLGSATATYQVLSYIGFAFPFLMSLAGSHTPTIAANPAAPCSSASPRPPPPGSPLPTPGYGESWTPGHTPISGSTHGPRGTSTRSWPATATQWISPPPPSSPAEGRPDGRLLGKQELRRHFARGLELAPDITFTEEVYLSGMNGYSLLYRRENGNRALDVVELDQDGRAARVRAFYERAQN